MMKSKIFKGQIQHHRYQPVAHSFRYAIYVYAIDIDELPQLDQKLALFGYNRHRLAALFDRDYLFREPATIREKLSRCLNMEGVQGPVARVILVTSARYLNYVFNPVSFYYCYSPDQRLLCVVTEVNNTYGERHFYVLKDPVEEAGSQPPVTTFQAAKAFHVSPFNRVDGQYEFQFSDIRKTLNIRIKLQRQDSTIFEARLTGDGLELTTSNQVKVMLQHPLVPHMSMPLILWEAFRLSFLKKLPFHDKPVPVSPKTLGQKTPTVLQALARNVLYRHFKRISIGQIKLYGPCGEVMTFGKKGGPEGEIYVKDYRFFTKTVLGGEIGFGESYVCRHWDCPDLPGLLGVLILNRDHLEEGNWKPSLFSNRLENVHHYFKKNEIHNSKTNIEQHYDISNDFFQLILDNTMTYSSAVFESLADPLENAQANKYRKIIEKADIQSTDHVLEIGCGWGGFALEAVKRTGCTVTAVTLSEAQYRYATQRVAREGLEDRIQVRVEDYRHISSGFDKIVSIEMLEAVGHQYLGRFFSHCDRLLKKNGLVVIQTIVNTDQRYPKEHRKSDWIKKHIFPGGQVPCLTAICQAMTRDSSLMVYDVENIGDHYALTLNRWRQALLDSGETLTKMHFDSEFKRKWDYYLALCEAGFSTRAIRNLQLVLAREFSDNPPRRIKSRDW
jgi:cyclopropane-fatty-acyl-phospholipid synthase